CAPGVWPSAATRPACFSRSAWTLRRTLARSPATGPPPEEDVHGDGVRLVADRLQDGVPDGAAAEVAALPALRVPVPGDHAAAAEDTARDAARGGLRRGAGPADVQAHGHARAARAEVHPAARLAVHDLAAHLPAVAEDAGAVALHPQPDVPGGHPVRLEAELEVRGVRRGADRDAPEHRAAVDLLRLRDAVAARAVVRVPGRFDLGAVGELDRDG